MTAKIRTLSRGFLSMHNDEDGMEAIQVVAIVAVAAIVLIFVKSTLWPKIETWVTTKTDELKQ